MPQCVIHYTMNLLWTVLTAVGLCVLTVTNPQQVLTVCVDGCSRALTTAVGLCGVYCLWLGVFNVAQQCMLVEKLAACFKRVNRFLYGNLQDVAANYVSLNLASNLLGVGNAATPSAIAAIKEMEQGDRLSRGGAMLFVINACGVQLVPTTVMGLRASMGSANPSDILLPTLLSTLASAALGVALVMAAYRKST